MIVYFALGIQNYTGVVKEDYVSGLTMFLIAVVSLSIIIGIMWYDLVEQTLESENYLDELFQIKKHYKLPTDQPFKIPETNI